MGWGIWKKLKNFASKGFEKAKSLIEKGASIIEGAQPVINKLQPAIRKITFDDPKLDKIKDKVSDGLDTVNKVQNSEVVNKFLDTINFAGRTFTPKFK